MKVTFKQKVLSIFLVLLTILSVFPMMPKQDVQAAETETISIITIDTYAGSSSQAIGWASRQGWLANAAMKFYNPIKGYVTQGTFASAHNLFTPVEGGSYYLTSFTNELFKDSSGKWVYCFDKGTPAEGTRYIGETLPSGYNLVNEDKLIELALVVEALFPDSTELSVLKANVSKFIKPAYQSKATAMFNSGDGSFGAAVIMQALVWKKVHNLDFCSLNDGNLYYTGGTFSDPKTGATGSFPPATYRNLTPIYDIINFDALYNFGLSIIDEGEESICYNVELNYQEKKEFTGKVAETITIAYTSKKLPEGIKYEKVGTSVFLTSNINENKDFGEIKAGGIAGTFSSSVPYNKGKSGQLIVKTHAVKNVCIRVKANATGSLQLQKVSAKPEYTKNNSNYSLAGAEYGVYKERSLSGASRVGIITTKEDGSTDPLQNLVAGRYYVFETKASKGFKRDPKVYTVEVKPGETTIFTSTEIPLDDPIAVAVEKIDKTTGEPVAQGGASLALAQFTFKFYAGNYAEGVDPAKNGAKPDKTWVLRTDGNGRVQFNYANRSFTYDGQSYPYKVSGSDFYLTTTGVPTLPLGTVTVQETKAPEGYELDPTVHVRKIEQGTGENVTTYNVPKVPNQVALNYFNIKKYLKETDESEVAKPEVGAVFTAIAKKYVEQYGSFENALAQKANFGKNEWTTVTTDKDGFGTSGLLAYGDYIVKQTGGQSEAHLLKDELTLTIESSDDDPELFEIINVQNKYQIKIIKVDEETGEKIVLTGASFKIKNLETGEYVTQKVGSKVYDTFKTTAENKGDIPAGTFYVDGEEQGTLVTPLKLNAGKYQAEEVKSPTGYLVSKNPIPFTVAKEEATKGEGQDNDEYIEVIAENKPQYGELVLHKQGEQFKEWVDESVTLKVQAEGITETVTKEVPRANETLTIERTWTETKEVEELVEVTPAVIDEETGEELEPAVEEIIKKTIEEEHIDIVTVLTDENGAYAGEVEEKGSYRVIDKNGEEVATLVAEEGKKETISVQLAPEIVEEEVKREGEVSDKDFTYKKAVFENGYLAGAEFSLTAKEEIKSYDGKTVFFKEGDKPLFAQQDITVDGKVVYKKGEVITVPKLDEAILADETMVKDTVVTENGALTISRIPLGKYDLMETKAPAGYIKDETIRTFIFTPQEQTILVDLKDTGMIENERQKMSAFVSKEVVGQENYDYIVIGMFTAEEILGLAKDSLVAVSNPDHNGALLVNDLPKGKYYFKEISTKDGYVLNEDQFELVLTPDEDAQTKDKIEKIKEPIVNKPKTKTITIVKQDKVTGKALANVEFRLYQVLADGSKKVLTNTDGSEKVFVTDANGKIVVENLAFGNYFLEEIKEAEGYIKDEQGTDISVADDSKDETVVKNDRISLAISKIDAKTGAKVVGAKLRLVDQDGNVVYLDENDYVTTKENGRPAEWTTDGTDFVVHGLKADGQYFVEEVEAPEGYHKAEEKVSVVVSRVKGLQLKEVPNTPFAPEGKTKAFAGDGMKETHATPKVPLADILYYKELIPGREYKAKAELVLVSDPSKVIAKGEITFIPETMNGEVIVPFGDVDLSALAGETLVVFENVIDLVTKRVVIKEEQPDNPEQQVKVKDPEVGTTATFDNGKKQADPISKLTVIDKVEYKDLIIGETYTVKGKLVDKEDPSIVIAENEVTFVAETENGTVEIPFVFDGTDLKGKELVVFEYLYYGEDLIGKHEDPEDPGQTVEVEKPEVKTTATANGSKEVTEGKSITIIDRVEYKNLVVGETYTVQGVLMDKATNKPLLVNGKEVRAEKTFVAETADGYVDLAFTFDGTGMGGKDVVVFEKLLSANGEVIAEHEDINDKDQTVTIKRKPVKPVTNDERTDKNVYLVGGVASVSLMAVALFFAFRKKEETETVKK